MMWKGFYRADKSVVGLDTETRCLSAPREVWFAIDKAALKVQKSRSQFVRDAVQRAVSEVLEIDEIPVVQLVALEDELPMCAPDATASGLQLEFSLSGEGG